MMIFVCQKSRDETRIPNVEKKRRVLWV